MAPEASSSRRQPVRATRINSARNTSGGDEVEEEAQHQFLPGITHFTNSISALPKEMIRHSTLLKEVDAKLFHLEKDLSKFVSTDLSTVSDPQSQETQRHWQDGANLMATMMGSLDEKLHVIAAANETLEKSLAECEGAWPLIEEEISEETRWGKTTHWAYTDKTADKKPTANAERASRRNNDAEKAAAAVVADITSSKGSKGHRRIGQDAADAEEAMRKSGQNKRKTADAATGLGITNGGMKRRKVEKSFQTNGGHAMEKSMSSVFKNIPGSPTISTADSKKKGKSTNGTSSGRRRAGTTTSNADSPSMASSPMIGAYGLPGRSGPSASMGGATMARTTSSRARGGPTSNPVQSTRPASAASTPLMNSLNFPDDKPMMSRTNSGYREELHNGDDSRSASRIGMKREDTNTKPRPPSISTASRNNGKASKTGTPVAGTFPDSSRPRSGRNSTTTLGAMSLPPPKRSHKKKEPAALQRQRSQQTGGRSRDEDESDDVEEADEPEQLYCYCNGPSHGEMVACDMPGCEKEWFHLECVGLTKPPSTKTKWYCPDCAPKLAARRGTERTPIV